MKISELWLREFIDLDTDNSHLFDKMTLAGLEVTSVKPVSELQGIIGEIINITCNEKGGRDNIAEINIGKGEIIEISLPVSNFNYYLGMKVVIGKIDGGIIYRNCNLDLCTRNDHIIELPNTASVGMDIREYLGLNDKIIEIDITPNRADCLSVMGIARDIAALSSKAFNRGTSSSEQFPSPTVDTRCSVYIEEPSFCPCYLTCIIENININVDTPIWISERLRRCGFSTTNILADIQLYLMIELGQPIGIFDFNRIDGGIKIRRARAGDFFTTELGKEVRLDEDTLVTADNNNILAVSGIASNDNLCAETKNILIESAYFNPLAISGRAKRYGFFNEIAHRYERGIDPCLQHKSIERIARLILDLCGGDLGPIIDHQPDKTVLSLPPDINVRSNKLADLIGQVIPDDEVHKILENLGFKVCICQDGWIVTPPSWRVDIIAEENVVGEVLRVYGYDKLTRTPLYGRLLVGKPNHIASFSLDRAKALLLDRGYQEVITYSFVDSKVQSLLHPRSPALTLDNPISNEMSTMRVSLWTGLLNTVLYNQNRQRKDIRIFESGTCFTPEKESKLGVRQELMLSGAISGPSNQQHWDLEKIDLLDFYDLKGDLESLLGMFIERENISFRKAVIPALHPVQSAEIYLKK
jgi:phenylalanyl-tRNA synthetase beta chain